ncbi:MAG: ABC transporter ATP-binding protein [Elusimicrobia bacterium]|nr:ABC transporter ATP-binding protein [Elusimicrobiota bacterium]
MDRLNVLKVSSVRKTYPADGGEKVVLDSVSLSVDAGDVVCLLGLNGSGKTTLLKIISGSVLADSGEVEVAGTRLSSDPDATLRRVWFSPGDEHSFYGRLSGRENLSFFGTLRGLTDARIAERLNALEAPLSLAEVLDVPYQKSSSGMKQRLSLSRALLGEPSLLLLDEPTKSLDPLMADRFREFMKRESGARRGAVIWSTHQADEAWEMASAIAVLDRGRIAAYGTPDELIKSTGSAGPKDAFRALLRRGA